MMSAPSSFLREPPRLGPRTRLGLDHLDLPQRLSQWLVATHFDEITYRDLQDSRQLVKRLESRIAMSAFQLRQQSRRNHIGGYVQLGEATKPSRFSNIRANLSAESLEIHRPRKPDVIPELETTIGTINVDFFIKAGRKSAQADRQMSETENVAVMFVPASTNSLTDALL